MSKKEAAESYPIRSLHDFLTELDKEWSTFKTASLIGMVVSAALLLFLIIRFVRLGLLQEIARPFRLIAFADEIFFLVFVAVFVIYEIFLLSRQYRFFTKWERRVGLLLHLEEQMMERAERKMEEPDKTSS